MITHYWYFYPFGQTNQESFNKCHLYYPEDIAMTLVYWATDGYGWLLRGVVYKTIRDRYRWFVVLTNQWVGCDEANSSHLLWPHLCFLNSMQ